MKLSQEIMQAERIDKQIMMEHLISEMQYVIDEEINESTEWLFDNKEQIEEFKQKQKHYREMLESVIKYHKKYRAKEEATA
jgi:hypothetical protein